MEFEINAKLPIDYEDIGAKLYKKISTAARKATKTLQSIVLTKYAPRVKSQTGAFKKGIVPVWPDISGKSIKFGVAFTSPYAGVHVAESGVKTTRMFARHQPRRGGIPMMAIPIEYGKRAKIKSPLDVPNLKLIKPKKGGAHKSLILAKVGGNKKIFPYFLLREYVEVKSRISLAEIMAAEGRVIYKELQNSIDIMALFAR